MPNNLPFNVYDRYRLPSEIEGPMPTRMQQFGLQGPDTPLTQKLQIDPSKLQKGPVPIKFSPYLKSPQQISGGSYPSEFMNDSVRSPMGNDFTMVPEGTDLPAVIEPSAGPRQPPIKNLPALSKPDIEAGKVDIGMLSKLMGMATPMGAAIGSYSPGDANANEMESLAKAKKLAMTPLDLQSNPIRDIANTNFNDPILLSMLSGKGRPASGGGQPPQRPPVDSRDTVNFVGAGSDDEQTEPVDNSGEESFELNGGNLSQEQKDFIKNNRNTTNIDLKKIGETSFNDGMVPGSFGSASGGATSSSGNSVNQESANNPAQRSYNASSRGGLVDMISNYKNKAQLMEMNRDEELSRLLGMRDAYTGSLSNKTNFDRMDLSPLAAFVDSMYGTKLSSAAKAPTSAAQEMDVINGLNTRVADYTKNKNAEQLAATKALLEAQNKTETNDLKQQLGFAKFEAMMNKLQSGGDKSLDMEAQKLSSIANDPSTRKERGQYKAAINGADKIYAMIDGLYPPTHANETLAEKKARYDQITPQQLNEVFKAYDLQLRGNVGGGTEAGFQHIVPSDAQLALASLKQKFGLGPSPAKQGDYILPVMDTLLTEKNLNKQKLDDLDARLVRGYDHLRKARPEQVNGIMGYDANGTRPSPPMQANLSDIDKAAIAEAMKNPNDPLSQQVLKMHGIIK